MQILKSTTAKIVGLSLIALVVGAVAFQSAMIFRLTGELGEFRTQIARSHRGVDKAPTAKGALETSPTAPDPGKAKPTEVGAEDWLSRGLDPGAWDPFTEMQRMQRQTNRMFTDSLGQFQLSPRFKGLARDPSFSPEIDIAETGDSYVVTLDLPGVDKGSVDINVDGSTLRVSGKRESVVDEKGADGHSVRRERQVGEFSRSVELPAPVDRSKMEVKQEKGVFTIVLPKATAEKAD